jgi:type VI secretion system protein ImpC
MFPSDSDYETGVTLEGEGRSVGDEPPFHVLLLGNWSGMNSSKADLSARRPVVIDRDNFDEVMRKLNVELSLQVEGSDALALRFSELDDFHPDRIFQQVSLFSELREMRRRLLNPNTYNEMAREIRSWVGESKSKTVQPTETASVQPVAPPVSSENLLDQILSQGDEGGLATVRQISERNELSEFVGKLVQPYLSQVDETEQATFVHAVDTLTSDLMRSILHHPQFKSLEAAWRGAYQMVRRVDTDVDLKIYLLDVSKEEFSDNLKANSDLTKSIFYKRFVEETLQTPGVHPWAVILGNFSFDLNVDDVATLIRIGKLAKSAQAPFIANVSLEMIGIKSLVNTPEVNQWDFSGNTNEAKLWNALRSQPESVYLGLAIPRFLVRLPYGSDTEPTETFYFEEFTSKSNHESYLWANPCFIAGTLLAQSYRQGGWEMSQSLLLDIEGLPTHLYRENGEAKVTPCTEVVITLNACDKLLEQGLMPVISYKNSDNVRLVRFQSVAEPLTMLKGRWNS